MRRLAARALLLVLVAACAGSDGSSGTGPEPAPGPGPDPDPGPPPPSGTTDDIRPAFRAVALDPAGRMLYGTPVRVSYDVEDAGGLEMVVVEREAWAYFRTFQSDTFRVDGAARDSGHVDFTGLTERPSWARIAVRAVDRAGNATDTAILLDFAWPPSMGGYISGPTGYTLVPGDTAEIRLGTSSASPLRWLGWSIGAPIARRDSIAVAGTEAQHVFRVEVTREWIREGGLLVEGFARDSIGELGTYSMLADVVDAVRRPSSTVTLPGTVRDAAFDASRDRLYLSQPDSGRVLVLSLATMELEAPIPLSGRPTGLDVSPDGATLLVALRSARALASVDLASGVVSSIPMPLDAVTQQGPDNLRISSNGRAIVTITHGAGGLGGVWEYDPAFGTVLPREDAGPHARSTGVSRIARSADRRRVLVVIDASCCGGEGAMLYDAGADAFRSRDASTGYRTSVSASADGSRFLVGPMLYDDDMRLVRQVAPPWISSASLLSADGTVAYFASGTGYTAYDVVSDAVRERVVSGSLDGELLLQAGDRLIGVVGRELRVVSPR